MADVTASVMGLIGLVIIVVIITALGPTIVSQTASNEENATGSNEPAGGLVNASATGKTMYNLVELLYPIVGVVIVITVGFALSKKL